MYRHQISYLKLKAKLHLMLCENKSYKFITFVSELNFNNLLTWVVKTLIKSVQIDIQSETISET